MNEQEARERVLYLADIGCDRDLDIAPALDAYRDAILAGHHCPTMNDFLAEAAQKSWEYQNSPARGEKP